MTIMRSMIGVFVAVLFSASSAFAGDKYDCLDAYNGQNYTEALRLCRPLAEQGEDIAQTTLGSMYEHGWGISQNDAEAVKWYRKAAEQGEAMAQTHLGVMYENGQGVTQDSTQAVSWFRKAAEQGEAGAQTALGVMYESGMGVPPDNVLALMWLNLAAAQGNGDAAKLRDSLARFMNPDQIAEAQRLALRRRGVR
jgi:uncharacterized protein